MKHLLICIATVCTLSIVASCNRENDTLGKDITIPVTVEEVKPGVIEEYTEVNGAVKPVMEVQLKAEIAGNYRLVVNPATGKPYALGDRVKAGAEIIEISDKEYENNIKLSSLRLSLEITKQVFDKQTALYEMGGVTLSELKNAEINYINANYSYEDALLRLDKLHIRSPFDGVIIDLPYYTPGVKIETGSSLVKLMDYSKLLMEVNLPEKSMGRIKPGQKVRVTNYTVEGDTFPGTVNQLSPAIDPDTRSYKGYILINNPALKLRPGMYVKSEIIVASSSDAIVIPKEVVVSKQRGNSVFVVEKGIAYERVVEFGLENPREVEIISGLNKADRLVVKGFETLRDKSKVKEMK